METTMVRKRGGRRGRAVTWRDLGSGQARARTGDLSIFSRTLYQLSYLAPGAAPGTRPAATSATPTGLEPATSAVTGRRANQLRYGALVVQDRVKQGLL
jgi:hypothetical protein